MIRRPARSRAEGQKVAVDKLIDAMLPLQMFDEGKKFISCAAASVLLYIASNPGVTVTEITRDLPGKRKQPWVSKRVGALVDNELVQKDFDPDDARRQFLHLTPRGAKMVDSVLNVFDR